MVSTLVWDGSKVYSEEGTFISDDEPRWEHRSLGPLDCKTKMDSFHIKCYTS